MRVRGNTLKIDVIIPVYKPGKELLELLDRLKLQSIPIQKIIIMNTEEKYFEKLLFGTRFTDKYPNVEIHHLSKREFDHGGTRHKGVKYSDADVFVMMTQDAVPLDEYLVERLVRNLKDKVAVSYARQLPQESCNLLERISRDFNYPDKSVLKTSADLETMGIKTFFCSDVCAAYRRDIYNELGGFVRHIIFNEDMVYAANAVKAGYGVFYEAEAKVIHSHNYSNRVQLKRNFDLAVSQAQHPEVFRGISSESEGKKLVKETCMQLMQSGKWYMIPKFMVQCISKYIGYSLGKNYCRLPRKWVLAITSNKEYWK